MMFTVNESKKLQEQKNEEDIGIVLHFIYQCAIHFLVAVSLWKDNHLLMTLTIGFSLIYAFLAEVEEVFYLIAGLSVYQYSFTLNGNNAIFLLVGVFLFKLLLKNRLMLTKSILSACCAGIILMIQCMNDIHIESKGEFIVVLVFIAFFLYVISNLEMVEFDPLEFILYYSVAILVCCNYVFQSYGGMMAYLKKFIENPNAFRFGTTEALSTGGAMEIPLYCLILLSVCVSTVISKKGLEWWKTLAIGGICLYALLIGCLTISRSFLLGVGVLVLFTLIVIMCKNIYSFISTLLVSLLSVMLIYMLFPELCEKIIANFYKRIEGDYDGGTGRVLIWKDCLKYLSKNPSNFLFGGGASRYITFSDGEKFSIAAGAHNILLDVLMSWGVIGFICFSVLLLAVCVRVYKGYGLHLMGYIPCLTYFAFAMTALRTTELTTWSYLLVSMFMIQNCVKEKKE